jgi:hypothetical membrane protein
MITITYSEIFNYIISCFGYIIIYYAVDLYRPNDKIKMFSKYWWLTILLVTIGVFILQHVDKWLP